jgi:uncharacterized protein DUF1559
MEHAMPPSRSLGIRLIDVAVVVGIFAVLAGLTMPIILKVRDAANKMLCASNLRQIAIAAHNYHNDYSCLPPGWLGPNPDGPDPSRSPNVGVLVEMIPYMESDNFYKCLYYQRDLKARTDGSSNLTPPADVPWWKLTAPGGASNLQLARTRLKMYECPSYRESREHIGSILAVHIYAPEAPEGFLRQPMLIYADRPEVGELARLNYLGVAGCISRLDDKQVMKGSALPLCAVYDGIFGNRSCHTLGQLAVQDGTSNTLMFGESCGGSGPEGGGAYTFSWFAGALPTYYGMPRGRNLPWYCFSSPHVSVVQFAFADGSTRGIRRARTAELYGDDWFLFQQLAGRRDGNSSGWE